MHFTCLYILKGETLDNVSHSSIEYSFFDNFSDGCGECNPVIYDLCDWFQIGGRWETDGVIKVQRGLDGEKSFFCEKEERKENIKTIAEIKDIESINWEHIYCIADENDVYFSKGTYEVDELGFEAKDFDAIKEKINTKQIKGVVALIDCHM